MPERHTDLAWLTGLRLRAFMLDWSQTYGQKLTIRTLAVALDVKEDRCGTWVSGKIEIPPFYASRLRELYGLSLEFLYCLDGNRVVPEYLAKRTPYPKPR